jgi:hypothetical protein
MRDRPIESSRPDLFCPGGADQGGHAGGLLLEHRDTKACGPVVPPPLIVQVRVRTLVDFLDESRGEHPLDRSVERAWSHPQPTAGQPLDLLHDCVAVPVAISQGEQDVSDSRRQRKEICGGTSATRHISVTDIVADLGAGGWRMMDGG